MRAFLSVLTLCHFIVASASAAPIKLVAQAPEKITKLSDGIWLVDFGKVAFGNIDIINAGEPKSVTVHFGEASVNGRIHRKPGGTIRYAKVGVTVSGQAMRVAPPADKRNTTLPAAILTPSEWGVVLPFRWVEIEGWQGAFTADNIRRNAGFAATWQDDAAYFESSDETLNGIWELCRYSIKATTFAGVYVDGDRERIPYEADAYLNQLSHYSCDPDTLMARDTFDHLMKRPTWPSEWAPHMVFMAYADWMHTGELAWLAPRYEALKKKTLIERAREDGLLVSKPNQIKRDDIVDWPAGERDGHVFEAVNTVVNAFHLRAVQQMAILAEALGKTSEAEEWRGRYMRTRKAFQSHLFDMNRGVYKDGETTNHSSIHSNLFPLAFGLVPQEHKARVIALLKQRGMKCSVYAAQYLLEGLLENGETEAALDLITAPGDRSWKHMLESGTTITWEAWDNKYKPNQDWNHAWGAAPANLLPRYIVGIRPILPGWRETLIAPQLGTLTELRSKVPTPFGALLFAWEKNGPSQKQQLELSIPKGIEARLELPAAENHRAYIDNKAVTASYQNGHLRFPQKFTGNVSIVIK